MTVALLNQKGVVGKTTLALHLVGQWPGKESGSRQSTPTHWARRGTGPDSTDASESIARSVSSDARAIGCIAGRPNPQLRADHVIIDGSPRPADQDPPALALRMGQRVNFTGTPCADRRAVIVADMLRDPLTREFPNTHGGTQ